MPKITLPALYGGETVVGGVAFDRGVAHTPVLTPTQREFFEFLGSEIDDTVPSNEGPVVVDFEKLNKAQIIEHADSIGVTLDPSLKKAELVEALTAATAPDEIHTVTATGDEETTNSPE